MAIIGKRGVMVGPLLMVEPALVDDIIKRYNYCILF